jgi:tetratricopeptide (TPR) repeat protein
MQSQTGFMRGKSLMEARNYREARERLGEAVVLNPDHDEARALLAWCEYFLGDFRGAIITFKSAIRHQPTWEGLYAGLGWSRLRLGRPHLAVAAFQPAVERKPEYLDAVNGLGSAYFELGQYDVALPHLEKALRGLRPLVGDEPPEATALRAKVAWSQYYVGRYREALATFVRASLADPTAQPLHVGMGWCYLRLGQKDDARSAFHRALKLAPGDEVAREGLRRAG